MVPYQALEATLRVASPTVRRPDAIPEIAGDGEFSALLPRSLAPSQALLATVVVPSPIVLKPDATPATVGEEA